MCALLEEAHLVHVDTAHEHARHTSSHRLPAHARPSHAPEGNPNMEDLELLIDLGNVISIDHNESNNAYINVDDKEKEKEMGNPKGRYGLKVLQDNVDKLR